ncbi:MAG: Zn-ribbon domain-containing OB-fold protein [Gammaproteobacteria bacterium]
MNADGPGTRPPRPRPAVEPHTREYWEGAGRRELVLQRCGDCRRWIHPPQFACPDCGSEAVRGERARGHGTLYSFSVMHMTGSPGFDTLPYAVAIVELDEQPGLITVGHVLDCAPGELRIGMRLEVDFEDLGDGVVLPQWRRATP